MSVKADGKPSGADQSIQINSKGAFGPNAVDLATQAELDAHSADTTNIHGIVDTADIVLTDDARLLTTIEKTDLTDGGGTDLHKHAADRDRENHTGTQLANTISNFSEAVDDRVSLLLIAGDGIVLTYNDGAGTLTVDALIDLATDVTGLLPVSNGGTGVSALPTFSAYKNANQSINNTTFTKVSFQNEDFDNNSNYDNVTNYRFTPTTAGTYLVMSRIGWNATLVDQKLLLSSIYKNGSRLLDGSVTTSGTGDHGVFVGGLVACNGSTDYIEIFAYQETGGSATIYGGTSPRGGFFCAARVGP